MDGKNQAAVIFLSQHSIPLEQQTMIPLFDENTDEVFKTFIKIIILLREFLLLWYLFDIVSGCNKSRT